MRLFAFHLSRGNLGWGGEGRSLVGALLGPGQGGVPPSTQRALLSGAGAEWGWG